MIEKNEKGFTLIQSLIAFSIVIMLVMTIVPNAILIKKEQHLLKEKLKNLHLTHDLLIQELNEPKNKNKIKRNANITYRVTYENDYLKVCSSWKNVKNVKENRCYYGKKAPI